LALFDKHGAGDSCHSQVRWGSHSSSGTLLLQNAARHHLVQAVGTVILMLRGVNVSGHRPLKMERLRNLCEGLGFSAVRTYLNSGNAVCEARGRSPEAAAAARERRIAETCGFEADVVARTAAFMDKVLRANPLAGMPRIDPDCLHATFLVGTPDPGSLDERDLPLGPGERAVLAGRVVYLHLPAGAGGTKISNAFLEKKLGVRATTRNWRTVTALVRIGRGEPPGP